MELNLAENIPLSKETCLIRLEKILRTLGEEKIPVSKKINSYSKLKEDLGLDSLDCYEYLYRFEKEFKTEIPDEIANRFICLEDYARYLRAY